MPICQQHGTSTALIVAVVVESLSSGELVSDTQNVARWDESSIINNWKAILRIAILIHQNHLLRRELDLGVLKLERRS